MPRIKDGFKDQHFFMIPESYHQAESCLLSPADCSITYAGYFPHALYHYRERPRGTEDYLLLYCMDGMGYIKLGSDTPREVQKNQIALLPPNTPHIYYASEKEPWTIYWIHLKGFMLTDLWESGMLRTPQYLQRKGCALLEGLFAECLETLKESTSLMNYGYACQIAGHMIGVVCRFTTCKLLTSKSEQAVETALTYMKQNLHRPITLQELSLACHYSPSYLNQLFKDVKHTTPINYFLQMRIQAASREIYFTQTPIKEIALKYGFEDPLYFSRIFKQTFGISPSQYRVQESGA